MTYSEVHNSTFLCLSVPSRTDDALHPYLEWRHKSYWSWGGSSLFRNTIVVDGVACTPGATLSSTQGDWRSGGIGQQIVVTTTTDTETPSIPASTVRPLGDFRVVQMCQLCMAVVYTAGRQDNNTTARISAFFRVVWIINWNSIYVILSSNQINDYWRGEEPIENENERMWN